MICGLFNKVSQGFLAIVVASMEKTMYQKIIHL